MIASSLPQDITLLAWLIHSPLVNAHPLTIAPLGQSSQHLLAIVHFASKVVVVLQVKSVPLAQVIQLLVEVESTARAIMVR